MVDARAVAVRRLSRALDRAAPEARPALRLERALWADDLDALLALLGDRHPDDDALALSHVPLLHAAIGIAGVPLLQALLDRGADVNAEVTDGFPALVNAIHHVTDPARRRAVVRVLLDAGADPERDGLNGWRPLHIAALTDDPALIWMLLDAGADPDAPTTVDDRWTALEEAEHYGHAVGAEAIREWRARQ